MTPIEKVIVDCTTGDVQTVELTEDERAEKVKDDLAALALAQVAEEVSGRIDQQRAQDMVTLLNSSAARESQEIRDAVARVHGVQAVDIPLDQDALLEDIMPL